MVIRLGRNGRFLACSLYPEHKESRPLPGDEPPAQAGTGEVCPKCGEGTLVGRTGRFGPFVGCSRYPECDYIKKDGPPPPDPLPFEVTCPKNQRRPSVPRRARRTGNVFWGCSNYPRCDYTTNFEPLGGLHDADDGPLARKDAAAICLICGSTSEADPADLVARRPLSRADRRTRRRWHVRLARGAAARPAAVSRRKSGSRRSTQRRAEQGSGARPRPSRPPTRDPGAGRDRQRPIRLSSVSSAHSPRATPRRTRSGPTGPRSAPTWHGWPPAAAIGATRRAADLRAYLAVLGEGHARTTVAQRLAAIRAFHRWATRNELAPGDPWGAIATPRLPRRLPRVLEVEQVTPAAGRRRGRSRRARRSETRHVPRSGRARTARPCPRRDGLRGGPADQRAGRRRARGARPAARRGPRPRQGPQGADRAPRAPGTGRTGRLPGRRTAGAPRAPAPTTGRRRPRSS